MMIEVSFLGEHFKQEHVTTKYEYTSVEIVSNMFCFQVESRTLTLCTQFALRKHIGRQTKAEIHEMVITRAFIRSVYFHVSQISVNLPLRSLQCLLSVFCLILMYYSRSSETLLLSILLFDSRLSVLSQDCMPLIGKLS